MPEASPAGAVLPRTRAHRAPTTHMRQPHPEGPRSQKQHMKSWVPALPFSSPELAPAAPHPTPPTHPACSAWVWAPRLRLQAAMLRAFAHAEEPPTRPGLVSSGPGGSSCPGCGPQQLLVFLPLQGDRLFLLLPESVFVICSWKHHLIKQALSGPASQRQRLTWAPRGRWRGRSVLQVGSGSKREMAEPGGPSLRAWLPRHQLAAESPSAGHHPSSKQTPGPRSSRASTHKHAYTHMCKGHMCEPAHT